LTTEKYEEKSTIFAQGKALEISRQGTDIKDTCSMQNPQLRDTNVVLW
jgi:hypothetical protein